MQDALVDVQQQLLVAQQVQAAQRRSEEERRRVAIDRAVRKARPEQSPRPALCSAHSLTPQVNTGSLYRCGKSD